MMSYNPFSLVGKTILVTGASSGIGRQTAIECSKMGATLVLNARDESRLQQTIEALEGSGHTMQLGELTDPDTVKALVKSIPSIDGCVLCAGKGLTLPVQFCSREQMDSIFDVNFFSTTELVRLLYKGKKLNKSASVVLIDSVGGVNVFSPGNMIYGASKAALNSFMKFCAIEFSQRRVRVNCICPGMVDTPFIHRGTLTEEQFEENARKYPCGRYGTPYDVACGAVYLLSDAAQWITGTSLIIDGGISIV